MTTCTTLGDVTMRVGHSGKHGPTQTHTGVYTHTHAHTGGSSTNRKETPVERERSHWNGRTTNKGVFLCETYDDNNNNNTH